MSLINDPSALSNAGPLWSIGWDDGSIPQEIDQVFPANGEPYDVYTVRFTTRSGARGHVRVPASRYNAETVAAAIEPIAAELENVHNMQRTPALGPQALWGFIISTVGRAFVALLVNPSSVTNTDVRDALVGFISAFKSLVGFLQTLLGDEMTAWKKAGPNVIAGGKGIGDLAYHELYAWERLLRVILPGSQRWQQYNTRRYVGPKFARIWSYLAKINHEVGQLFRWRANYVNPRLAELSRFRRFMLGWPLHSLAVLHNWLVQPRRFAAWATPILVPSFLQWLAAPRHKAARDDVTRIVVGAVSDIPDQVGYAVLHVLEGPVTK